MARPVSRAAAMRNGGAVDLSVARLTDREAQEAQEYLELRGGLRCGGCGRRLGIGFRFTSIDPRSRQPIVKLSACSRADCGFAAQCREGATLVEFVEYAWADVNGLEAPASTLVEANPAAPATDRAPES